MKFYLGVTNNSWYNYLSTINPEDVNFWQPGGNREFKVIPSMAPFLFKLKSPLNAIGGVGFFSSYSNLPLSVAWEIFGNRNGCKTYEEFRRMIVNYRKDKENVNPTIGCIVLTNPLFFKKSDWIETPSNWSGSIVQGKSYSTGDEIGQQIWAQVNVLIQKYLSGNGLDDQKSFILSEPESPAYGNSILQKVRRGQGAFRVLVTDTYHKRCSITGEKTLPVLEAAHIKPYAESLSHDVSNGILLRSDIHKLFDSGYMTITKDLVVEVSNRIKEEFHNGKEYYQYHGKSLMYIPAREIDKPSLRYVEWHNNNVFRR